MGETEITEEEETKVKVIDMTFKLRSMVEKNLMDKGIQVGYYIEGNSEIIQRYESLAMVIAGIMDGIDISDEEKLTVLLRGLTEYIKSIES